MKHRTKLLYVYILPRTFLKGSTCGSEESLIRCSMYFERAKTCVNSCKHSHTAVDTQFLSSTGTVGDYKYVPISTEN